MRGFGHILAAASLLLSACGGDGGSGSGSTSGGSSPTSSGGSTGGSSSGGTASVYTAPALEALSTTDVERIIAQAANQASSASTPAVIAVTDRVGNVLALFRMTGAPATAKTSPAPNGASIDAQNLDVPAEAAAIAKAVTGAYLSSGGNAFSTRTASMIVQTHFPPAPSTAGLESGPLFGVQFSQLPCSDLAARFTPSGADALIGPKRSPLGLAADPGGFPLYKNGVLVGGVGAIADGVYGFDANVLDIDSDADERIALAGTVGFEAPAAIRANQITVDGTSLRYSDIDYSGLFDVTGASYAATNPALGMLVPLTGYYASPAAIRAGTAYGSENSGIRRATAAEFAQPDAFVLTDGLGGNRYPVKAGTDAAEIGTAMSAAEARAILGEAFAVMAKARAQIRRPLDSRAQVTISLVDTRGAVLGIVRSPDAPIFGIDVSLQKARTAAFLSNANAGAELLADPSADVRGFVAAMRMFIHDPAALAGTVAYSNRAIGNLARPYFPDGEVGRPNGPLSRPVAQFNPFSTGLQSALVLTNLAQHLNYISGASSTDTAHRCTFLPDAVPGQNRLQNGIQIFPGSFPVYRGGTLVGAIGVSGDGIDQDDMISFLGLNNAGQSAGGIGNAAAAKRADNVTVNVGGSFVRLRYVNCPFAPFIGTSDQNVCQGL
ncbi:MAG: heme-binding protein [Novosphingobium sp.]